MKSILLSVLFVFALQSSRAADYYFSSTTGDDSRSFEQAQNPATPWKSVNKFNAIFSSLKPGDAVYFKRGETFYGGLRISKSGTAGADIRIAAYGSGAKPVISGLTPVSDWKSIGGGVYESASPVSSLSTANMVVKGDKVQQMGRYPNINADNGGYRIFESYSGKTSITDNDGGLANWKGAEVVVRSIQHLLDRATILSNTSTTINHDGTSRVPQSAGYGYFIQNHPNTLDQAGEWYYNPDTKKLRMYSGATAPGTVGISSEEYGAEMVGRDYITFEGLSFEGANAYGFKVYDSHFITINNCDILFAGQDGINGLSSSNTTITNSLIEWSNDSGIKMVWAGQTAKSDATIRGNVVRNTGMFAGMGKSGEVKYMGIVVYGSGNVVEYNTVENTGYCPVYFVYGSNTLIKNNFINKFCMTKNDGGAIYSWNKPPTPSVYTGIKITGNIVMNGVGVREGTPNNATSTHGIYFDNNVANIEVSGNTVTNVDYGLFNYNAYNNNIHHNTFYNNRMRQIDLNHSLADQPLVRNVTVKHNIMVAKTTSQYAAIYRTIGTDIAQFGTMDSNYYARPLNEEGAIRVIIHQFHQGATQIAKNYDLETWKSLYGKDKASKSSPKTFSTTIDPDDVIRFEYNPTQSNKTITLNSGYVDLKGKTYYQNIVLAPYSSAVLLKDNTVKGDEIKTNEPPIVSIISPKVNSNYDSPATVQLSASAEDEDGSISKVEFYNGSTLITTEKLIPYDWTWTNVPEGTYTITAKATDNSGNVTTSEAVTFTVGNNNFPVVEITSPIVNASYSGSSANVRLTANASDADGAISKVQFYNGSTLVKTEYYSPYDWVWKDVPAGTYNLVAKATDNKGNVTTSEAVTFYIGESANEKLASHPTVTLISPKVNESFSDDASVRIIAKASDDGRIANVKFYHGTTLITTEYTAPYDWTWKNVKAGTYNIVAKATDKEGNLTISEEVTITVGKNSSRMASSMRLSGSENNNPAVEQSIASNQTDNVQLAKESTLANFTVFPNPAVDKIKIQFNNFKQVNKTNISIQNMSGNIIRRQSLTLSGNVVEVDVSALSAGMYIISITDNNSIINKEFLKL